MIAPTTPISVKFEIFKRINEGGKPLNNQEIRNSMAKAQIRTMIKRMADSEHFKRATANSVKAIRMEDQELVLRYIGFCIVRYIDTTRAYKGDMETFLDETLDFLNNNVSDTLIVKFERLFDEAMKNAYYLFGKNAFRKITLSNQSSSRRPLINKSLFTVWSVVLTALSFESICSNCQAEHLVSVIAEAIENDVHYFESLTTGTNQLNKLNYGFKVAESLIQHIINKIDENVQ